MAPAAADMGPDNPALHGENDILSASLLTDIVIPPSLRCRARIRRA